MAACALDISIVTYNSHKWVESFIKSLLELQYDMECVHLYFTDNSSTDDTYDLLQQMKARYEESFAGFDVFLEPNDGFGSGHNNNLRRASADYVLVTNLDLVFEKDALAEILRIAQQDDGRTAAWELRQKPYEHPKLYDAVTGEVNWASSACVLFRREAVLQVGGYDSRIFMYGEDVDLSYRLRDAGYVLKYCPRATVWHYTYESENELKPLQFFGSVRARVLLAFRFASRHEAVASMMRYMALLLRPQGFAGQRRGLLVSLVKLLRDAPYFMSTRKKSHIDFHFMGWDYEARRDGAFYTYAEKAVTEPCVSVIMRTYGNRMGFLREAVQSIINQTYRNVELVVVEDGSAYAEDFVRGISPEDIARVQYCSIEKAGRCVAGNKGLSLAKGDYFVFLDDDDLFYADHIEVLVQAVTDYKVKAAYTSAFEVQTEVKSLEPLEYIEHNYAVRYRQPFSRVMMWHHNYIPIQSILFSRDLYDAMGGVDLELDNLEDWNLWTRYSAEHDFKYIEKTTSMYRVPLPGIVSEERQQQLDYYYQKARKKQAGMMLQLSVMELSRLLDEAASSAGIQVGVPADEQIFRNRFLNKLYCRLRRFYHKCLGA